VENSLRKLLIMGLPGTGKASLANAIALRLNAVVFNLRARGSLLTYLTHFGDS
jgi:SpoVK/Ycf46/Vps4 family AAA+-type ATPase